MNTFTFRTTTKKIILGCILLLATNMLNAQNNKIKSTIIDKWSVNLNGGSTQYWGQLNSKDISSSLNHAPTWGFGLVLSHQFSPVWGMSGHFLMGKIKGRKDVFSDGTPANLIYFSELIEGDITAKFSFTNLIKEYKPTRKLNVYGLAGLGLSNFQGETTNLLTYEIVHSYGHGKGKGINSYELEGLVTTGIGLSFKLNKYLDFTFENSMKFINTNKLNEINSMNIDLYGYSSIGISYNFSFSKKGKIVPLAKSANSVQQKPTTADKKNAEVKKEEVPAPVKTEPKPTPANTVKEPEVKKEIATVPAPIKTEPKVSPVEEVKKPIEKVALFSGYKVQILATLNAATFENIMMQYKLDEQIREDHVDKWYRYSVGEFQTFSEANGYMKILYTRNNIKDSFIVKFLDGKRVGQVWK